MANDTLSKRLSQREMMLAEIKKAYILRDSLAVSQIIRKFAPSLRKAVLGGVADI